MKESSFWTWSLSRRQWLWQGLSVGLGLSALMSAFGKEQAAETIRFKIPAGFAVRTLAEAARQSRVEIIYSAKRVKGVKTRAIKGVYLPLEAFNLMLEDSVLVMVKHQKSGVYLIERQDRTRL